MTTCATPTETFADGTCVPTNSPSSDFASTALWTVIICTVTAAFLLGIALFLMKRHMRRRVRERVRLLLWDLVRGVREGTVEEEYLRRVVWGPDGTPQNEPLPKITEYYLDLEKRRTKQRPCYRWKELSPLSITPPFVPGTDPNGNTAKIASRSKAPSLFQWPQWRGRGQWQWLRKRRDTPANPSLEDAGTIDQGGCGSSPVDTTELKASKPLSRISPRQINTVFVVEMPYQRSLPTMSTSTSTSTSSQLLRSSSSLPFTEERKIVKLPLSLASASPIFQEDVSDPIPIPASIIDQAIPAFHTVRGRDQIGRVGGPLSSVGRSRNPAS